MRRAGTPARGPSWRVVCASGSTTCGSSTALYGRRRICGPARANEHRASSSALQTPAWADGSADHDASRVLSRRSREDCRSPVSSRPSRDTGAGRPAHHAARRHRITAARSLRRGTPSRDSHRAAGGQLGSSLEQVGAARAARPRDRLERRAAAEAVDYHGVPPESRRRHRCAMLRPVVRSSAGVELRGVSAPVSDCGPIGRSSCMRARRCFAAP
jgi:hypothetical protein